MSSPGQGRGRPASNMVPRSSSRPTPTARINTDETWIFLRGGWGELRLGDEDGVVDNSVIGGQTIAAGTGGIDGSDAVITAAPGGLPDSTPTTPPRSATTRRASAASALGVSYTPTQEEVDSGANEWPVLRAQGWRRRRWQGQNVFEGGLVYDGELGGVGIEASVVGLYGELKNGGEDDFGGDKWWGVQGGAALDLFRLQARRQYRHRSCRRPGATISSPPASATASAR